MAVLADGRVVTGGADRRVLIWDPARPGTVPAELGRHDGPVRAAAVLADGRVVTAGGGFGQVLIWHPASAGTQVVQLSCWVTALAAAPPTLPGSTLAIAHQGGGLSLWSVTA